MEAVVLGFTGPIGSGKSTVSKAIADVLGWPRASFGDYVRSVARERGLRQNRETLQTIGPELINAGWGPFCEAVFSQAGWERGSGIVVDGIRHIEAIETIRRMTVPLKFVLVFISIAEADRQSRLVRKGIKDKKEQLRIESHSTETHLSSLRSKADFIVDGTQSASELVDLIMRLLNSNS
ncbi:AAA family ATPase [Chloroflexota bacterium]